MKRLRSLKALRREVWSTFSSYVRQSNADWQGNVSCFTCGKRDHWKNFHAGHFKHNRLDFDEMNINPQCPGCNTYRDGRLDVYAMRLIDKYGLDAVRDLERRAATITKYSRKDLESLLTKYQVLLKELNGQSQNLTRTQ